MLSGKETYCYIYDYEQYKKEFGFNIDLKKEFKNFSFAEFSDIINEIEKDNYNFQEAKKFVNKYVENFDGKSTKRITNFLLRILE